jgi:hypothetical protein
MDIRSGFTRPPIIIKTAPKSVIHFRADLKQDNSQPADASQPKKWYRSKLFESIGAGRAWLLAIAAALCLIPPPFSFPVALVLGGIYAASLVFSIGNDVKDSFKKKE